MKALVFGVEPEPVAEPQSDNPLVQMLAKTPMRLMEVDDPGFLRPDWVVCAPRITGICGSDSKQVFMDWGEFSADNPMIDFTTFPHILGHEVVADVVALGPEAEGLEVGQRVVLNPWLSCAPRGVTPLCPACAAGDLSLCWNFQAGPIAAGIHSGTSKDASGGYATLMPAHDSMLFPVPDSVPDEIAMFADPFAVALHAVTRHAPQPHSKVLVYGAGALGSSAVAILRALHPDVEVGVVARFESQAELARKLGAARVFAHEPLTGLIEDVAAWSGGVLHGHHELPMAYPGGVDVVYDTISRRESLEVSCRVLQGAGHDRQGRCPRPDAVGVDPALLQGDLVVRLERVRHRGGRRGAQARDRALPRSRAAGSHRPRTDAHPPVRARRLARRVRGARGSGAVGRDQSGVAAVALT